MFIVVRTLGQIPILRIAVAYDQVQYDIVWKSKDFCSHGHLAYPEFWTKDVIGSRLVSLVFSGNYEKSIDVAIKRVLRTDTGSEIDILKDDHNHINIINYYCTEQEK